MKTNIIKKQMLILSAIMICLSSLTSCAGIEKNNDKNISPLIGLLIGGGSCFVLGGIVGWNYRDNKYEKNALLSHRMDSDYSETNKEFINENIND